jgi:hypothetical protein
MARGLTLRQPMIPVASMSAASPQSIEVPADPSASPFKLVVDPTIRARLREALLELIDNHDQELAKYASEGFLELDSYKEYVELFARYLRDTMGTKEGISYLLAECGFHVRPEEVILDRETRWKVAR